MKTFCTEMTNLTSHVQSVCTVATTWTRFDAQQSLKSRQSELQHGCLTVVITSNRITDRQKGSLNAWMNVDRFISSCLQRLLAVWLGDQSSSQSTGTLLSSQKVSKSEKKANDETTSIIINPTAKQAKVQSSFNENNARTLMARSTVTLFTFQLLENSYQLKQIYKNNINALTKSAQ